MPRLRLFTYILAVPVIGFVVAEALLSINEHDNLLLTVLSWASVGPAAVGLLLLVAIRAGGVVSAGNRNRLLALFRPGLYLTAVVLAGLIIAHTAIAVGTIFYISTAVLRRVHLGLMLVIAVGGIGGAGAMIQQRTSSSEPTRSKSSSATHTSEPWRNDSSSTSTRRHRSSRPKKNAPRKLGGKTSAGGNLVDDVESSYCRSWSHAGASSSKQPRGSTIPHTSFRDARRARPVETNSNAFAARSWSVP